MSNNFNVNGFLQTLEVNQPKPREDKQKFRSIDKIYLSYPDNYGKYQIFPMNSTVTGFPFVSLPKTREIYSKRSNTLPDGTVNEFNAWIRILPREAYQMLDASGRLVSSLTAEEDQLLSQATALFDKLYEELDGSQKEKDLNNTIGFMRRRNYTVFFAKCLNKWGFKNAREAEKTNFAGLFVCTAKDFLTEIGNNISNCAISHPDDTWLSEIYNRNLSGRTGCLIFSINLNQGGGKVGYSISAQHCDNIQTLKDWTITEEEAELMQDPVEAFLGWQGSHEEPGRLFNARLMRETIDYMSAQYQAIQYAKQNGGDIKEAIKNTIDTALLGQVKAQASVDPILNAQSQQPETNVGNMYAENTNPYSNPPAAQIDPISQNPVAPTQSAPYSQPSWGAAPQGSGWGQPQQTSGSNPFASAPASNNPFNNPFATH